MLELSLVGRGQLLALRSFNDVDCEATVRNRAQECVKLEITDELRAGWHDIGRVEIVPDVGNLAYGDPVVALVGQKALFSRHIARSN